MLYIQIQMLLFMYTSVCGHTLQGYLVKFGNYCQRENEGLLIQEWIVLPNFLEIILKSSKLQQAPNEGSSINPYLT